QYALALYPPAVAGERPIVAHDPVAGNSHSDIICCAGLCHRANRLRRSYSVGDVDIARGLPDGNLPQRLPDSLLKGRAAQIEGQIKANRRCFDEADDLSNQRLEPRVAADQLSMRKAVLEIAGKHLRVVADEDGADAFA